MPILRNQRPSMLRVLACYKTSRHQDTARQVNEPAEADRARRVGEQFGRVFPGVVQYTTDVLFRDLWLRPGLAPRDRSLITVTSLIASGQIAQLAGHLNIGMNNGLTQTEIAE